MFPRVFGSLALVTVLGAPQLGAQAHLVKDIRVQTSPAGSSPGPLGTVGNITYFFATLPATGTELWKTDGTSAGTQLVSDICPGACSGVEQDYGYGIPVGNRLLFAANDGHQNAFKLWTTDGTAAGTMMLSSLTLNEGLGLTSFIVSTGSLAYFNAKDPASGTELWVTDGTVAGTHLVTDLSPGTASSSPLPVGKFGSRFLFRAGPDRALYITDGTEQGTHLVSPVYASLGVALGNVVVLAVLEPDQSWSLWKTDGTSAGTTLVRGGFKSIDQFAIAGGALYMVADDGINGSEVWRSDGTASGTSLVTDLNSSTASAPLILDTFHGGLLIFRQPAQGNHQLWISDGTAAGTRLLTEQEFVGFGGAAGGRYVFPAEDSSHGMEVWSTDGTSAGTRLVSDADPGQPASVQPFGFFLPIPGGVFFNGNDGVHGVEPWVSDGTPAGTHMLKDLVPQQQLGSDPSSFAALGGNLVFTAYDGAIAGLWTSNDTAPGTFPFVTFTGYRLYGSVVNRGIVYFGIFSPPELWRNDGTTAGTFRLYHLSDSGGGYLRVFPFKNGVLFDGQGGSWFSDGTIAGTHVIFPSQTFYGEMTAGGYFYGSANGQPYRTDGTAAGTNQITTTSAASESQLPGAFTQVGGAVYFAAYLHDSAFNLWRTDMTTTQAALVHHFDGRAPGRMWSAGGGLMFFTEGQLWRSDGTEAGTVKLLDDANARFPCNVDTDVITGDGVLYWYKFPDAASVGELWRSDGTVPGTFKLASLDGPYATSMQSCYERSMAYGDGHLYFDGRDPVHGAEPWISDGTIAGTHLLDDVNPGIGNSDPGPFLKIGPTLYFAAYEPSAGRELWAMTNPDCPSCATRRRAVIH